MKLKEALQRKDFVVTSEFQSPMDKDPNELIESLKLVRGRVDGVSLSEIDFEGVAVDSINACDVLKHNRFEPIYQTTTRNKDRLQLQQDLLHAHESCIDNLLVFTEDYRITGDSLNEMMFFHVDAGKLQSVLEHLRKGQTLEGKELSASAEFFMGSGVESGWGKNVPDLEMKEMEEMIQIGTGYFLTTPVFDLDRFEKFLGRTNTFGIPVIAEVMIIRTAGMAKFLNRHMKPGLVPEWMIRKLSEAADKEQASIELFSDTIKGLKQLCQGVHIITIGGEDKLRKYFDAAGLK
ncbi:MAG: methylenetetrahydrofolate reductase [Proteobacteria bacterium]|nr:methylenetetrahydrofolate reductase [Pseudomonadota bacterium]